MACNAADVAFCCEVTAVMNCDEIAGNIICMQSWFRTQDPVHAYRLVNPSTT